MELTGLEKVAAISGIVWVGGSLLFASGYGIYRKLSKRKDLPPLVARTTEEIENDLAKAGVNEEKTNEIFNSALEQLVVGLDNKKVGQILYNKIAPNITSYSGAIERVKTDFEKFEHGFLPNMFRVFDSFTYNGREVYPSETVHKLIDNSQKLYVMLKDKILRKILSSLSDNSSGLEENESWKEKFNSYLNDTVNLAEDTAYWIKRLSKREDIVGRKIREKLRSYGINQPEKLPNDVRKLGKTITGLIAKVI